MPRAPRTRARAATTRSRQQAESRRQQATTEVIAIECDRCFDRVYNRSGHEQRNCGCRRLAVHGGPGETTVARGRAHRIVTIKVKGSLDDLALDASTLPATSIKYPIIRFHRNVMQQMISLFPISWSSTESTDAGVVHWIGKLELAQPRNLFDGARVVHHRFEDDRNRVVWAEKDQIVCRLRYTVTRSGADTDDIVKEMGLRRVVLMNFALAEKLRMAASRLSFFREGWNDALGELARSNPNWHNIELPIQSLVRLDVMAVKKYTRYAGFRQGLLAKKRLGNIFVQPDAT